MIEEVEFLVVGAGVTGLAFANAIDGGVVVVEKNSEPGGYCRTITQDGFVWDYSGHFFHFKDAGIEAWLRMRMAASDIYTVEKKAFIRIGGKTIDFPFQRNIHQLDKVDFISCLTDLYFKEERDAGSFLTMLYGRFGRAITELFLRPYNEKLYATDLDRLDKDAMGRFFPHASFDDVMTNMRSAQNHSYNSTFTYPAGGAKQYIDALLYDLDDSVVRLDTEVLSIDRDKRLALTSRGTFHYQHLVNTMPFPRLLRCADVVHDARDFSSNKVLVFNLGFDKKGARDIHWLYFPDKDIRFYRVGFYDNIANTDRMSLYVEIGAKADAQFDIDEERARVLADLRRCGIVSDQELVSHHHVVLDPAYVHITEESRVAVRRLRQELARSGIHTAGRYGSWTYCSIEDNIIEARALAERFP